ncbi:MAG: ribonucleoside-diphosphate reductase subunit alpha [Candidatus Saccharimonadia bacterium]
MPEKVKKRNGIVVEFDPSKIKVAIVKAFMATRGGIEPELLDKLSGQVMGYVNSQFAEKVPSVEDVQNIVESVLMSGGYFDVAKNYIIYRYEHTKIRQENLPEDGPSLYVVKHSGQRQRFSLEKIKRTLRRAVTGYESIVDVDVIAAQCQNDVYDGIATDEIFRALVFATRALVERDPAYSKVASRLLCQQIYREVAGEERLNDENIAQVIKRSFIANIHRAVEAGKLDRRMAEFDLDRLADSLDLSRDDLFMYLGIQTLYDRYLLTHPDTQEILETPQAFWMRVSMGIAINENNPTEKAIEFYNLISSLRFVPSTPTLFHAGTSHPQLSSCYLTTVEDSLDHIFKCIGDNAQLSKWSGGLGNDWTNLRGTGAHIKGTGVESQGVIPFLKVANDTTAAINRSGRRRGATCAYLEVWHYDIEAFAELRKNTGDERRRTHDMDTAAWIPDLFMKRVRSDGDWTLFSPDETPDLHHIYGRAFEERYEFYEAQAKEGKIALFRTIKAHDLWRKLLSMLYETGHPWITFKDPSNIRSPQDHAGVVHSSNLCTEITLNTSADETAVCNLGSLNLAMHIKDGQLDQDLIRNSVNIAMRMLDNVIDANFYPTPEAKNSNFKHRPVGLGIMGFQDSLYLLDIEFASKECVRFADYSMEVISYHTIMASSLLARERGSYPSFKGSKWDRGILPLDTLKLLEEERGVTIDVDRTATLDWDKVRESIRDNGMRNSNTMACAPTATISNIAGCVPTIEPIYKNIYVKSNQGGDFVVINSYLIEDLKKLNLWNQAMLKKLKYHDGNISQIEEIPVPLRNKYKEVFDIEPIWLIKAAAHRGKWIDQSQSFNIYYSGTSGAEIDKIYRTVWELGLKTTYYLRTLAASQVEKSTVNTSEFGATHLRQQSDGNIEIEKPEVESKPVSQVQVPVGASAEGETFHEVIGEEALKLCKLDDPTCEACQ